MTMQANGGTSELGHYDIDTDVSRVDTKAVAVLNRSEVEAQLDAAHRHPRHIKRFMNEALTLATLTREVAESSIYAVPRDGKIITGPSVRLAEIIASAYGNLHIGARVVDVEEREVVAQGVAWDLEKNLRATVEVRRRITSKNGRRYSDDMVTTTGAAAASIALRNAIYRVVPRAYVDNLFGQVKRVAVGDATTLVARRAEVVARLQKIGVPIERIFARVGKTAIQDVGLEELEVLIGLGTSIKNGERSIDEAFPDPDTTAAQSKALEAQLAAGAPPPFAAPASPEPVPAKTDEAPGRRARKGGTASPAGSRGSSTSSSLPATEPHGDDAAAGQNNHPGRSKA